MCFVPEQGHTAKYTKTSELQNPIQKNRQYAKEQPLHKAKFYSYLCTCFTFPEFYVGEAPHQQKLHNVWHGIVTMNTFTVDS